MALTAQMSWFRLGPRRSEEDTPKKRYTNNLVHRLCAEEGLMDVEKKMNESSESFSLRAFGVNDDHWCMQMRRGDLLLLLGTSEANSFAPAPKGRFRHGERAFSTEELTTQAKSTEMLASRRRSMAEKEGDAGAARRKTIRRASIVVDKQFVGLASDLRALLQRLRLMHCWPMLRGSAIFVIGQLRGELIEHGEEALMNRQTMRIVEPTLPARDHVRRSLLSDTSSALSNRVGCRLENQCRIAKEDGTRLMRALKHLKRPRILCLHGFSTSSGILRCNSSYSPPHIAFALNGACARLFARPSAGR